MTTYFLVTSVHLSVCASVHLYGKSHKLLDVLRSWEHFTLTDVFILFQFRLYLLNDLVNLFSVLGYIVKMSRSLSSFKVMSLS